MINKYTKKPVIIEAVQWTGDNINEVKEFVNNNALLNIESNEWNIYTLEGIMTAKLNDYIIKGVKGEFYPCKPDIFEETYSLFEEKTRDDILNEEIEQEHKELKQC